MSNYKHKYFKYKTKYLKLQSNKYNMTGGNRDEFTFDPEITKKIDEIAKEEIKNLKSVGIKDLCSLVLRVYKRDKDNKDISPIIYLPPKVSNYIENSGLTMSISWAYGDYYENKYGDITKNELKDLILDFGTQNNKIKVAFSDNYSKGIKKYFEVDLPIKLVDFIEKLFNHFDEVGLVGYPDNGGIDPIKYDEVDDIYLVQTWS